VVEEVSVQSKLFTKVHITFANRRLQHVCLLRQQTIHIDRATF